MTILNSHRHFRIEKSLLSLDLQGFWPDGIYSAPCDEGLRYDIEAAKSMGLNMLRKHIKVEPDRSAYTMVSFAFTNSFNHSCCSLDPFTHPPKAPIHVITHWLACFIHSTHSTHLLRSLIPSLIRPFPLLLIYSLAHSLTHSDKTAVLAYVAVNVLLGIVRSCFHPSCPCHML